MPATLNLAGPGRLPRRLRRGVNNGVTEKEDKATLYAFYYLMTVLVVGLIYIILLSFIIE